MLLKISHSGSSALERKANRVVTKMQLKTFDS